MKEKSSIPSPSASTDVCPVCLDNFPPSQLVSSPTCSHKLCNPCILRHLTIVTKEQTPLACPICRATYPPPLCLSLTASNPTLHSELQNYLVRNLHNNLRYCANPRCATPFDFDPPPTNTPDRFRVVCPLCTTATCASCSAVYHSGPCDANPDQSAVAAVRRLAQDNRWRLCPNCGHLVEKTIGCRYVTCRCGTGFCYECGGTSPLQQRLNNSDARRCSCRNSLLADLDLDFPLDLHRIGLEGIPPAQPPADMPQILDAGRARVEELRALRRARLRESMVRRFERFRDRRVANQRVRDPPNTVDRLATLQRRLARLTQEMTYVSRQIQNLTEELVASTQTAQPGSTRNVSAPGTDLNRRRSSGSPNTPVDSLQPPSLTPPQPSDPTLNGPQVSSPTALPHTGVLSARALLRRQRFMNYLQSHGTSQRLPSSRNDSQSGNNVVDTSAPSDGQFRVREAVASIVNAAVERQNAEPDPSSTTDERNTTKRRRT